MTVSGGANVTSGTAGLSFTSLQVNVQSPDISTHPSNAAPVTFDIVNPVGGGTTLLSIGTLNMSNFLNDGTVGGNGYGDLVLLGNGNFSVTTAFTGGSVAFQPSLWAPVIPGRPTSRAPSATPAPLL